MARTRDLKPAFFKNEELGECSFEARLCFAGLWTLCDREGRLEYKAKRIKAELFPYDDISCRDIINQLHGKKLLVIYEIDKVEYIWIPGFTRHQRPHPHEAQSVIPPAPVSSKDKRRYKKAVTCNDEPLHDTASCAFNPLILQSSNPLILQSNSPSISPPAAPDSQFDQPDLFEIFWKEYPPGRKASKARAQAAWLKAIKRADPQTIIDAAIEYAASPVGRGDYVKGPEPWLNGDCWNDDRAAWNRKDSNGKPNLQLSAGKLFDPNARGDF